MEKKKKKVVPAQGRRKGGGAAAAHDHARVRGHPQGGHRQRHRNVRPHVAAAVYARHAHPVQCGHAKAADVELLFARHEGGQHLRYLRYPQAGKTKICFFGEELNFVNKRDEKSNGMISWFLFVRSKQAKAKSWDELVERV